MTALYRFLATASFPNDEHEYLAGAQQILLAGEWPTRDFFDPGRPLMYAASAAAQVLFGHTLFAEAVLTSVAFGVAAALVLIAAHRLSASLIVAVMATVLCVALFPRPYAYPKVLLYAAGPLVMWAWAGQAVARPDRLDGGVRGRLIPPSARSRRLSWRRGRGHHTHRARSRIS